MIRFNYLMLILPLTFAACMTTPEEPKVFNVELISFQAEDVPIPIMGGIPVPGYIVKFRRGALANAPDRTSYNIALMGCDNEEYFEQGAWLYEIEQLDDGSATYAAPFYKDDFDRLNLPSPLCAQIIVGKRKIETKGVGYEKVKYPVLISNKMQLRVPN